jgi:peptidoglycan/LPS O-acetylase OafA/YrhL
MLAGVKLRRPWLLASIAGAACASCLLRLSLWDDGAGLYRVYYGLDTRADSILIGCGLAVLVRGQRHRRLSATTASVLAIALTALGFAAGPQEFLLVPLVAPTLTAVAIYAVAHPTYAGWLSGRAMVHLGRRSYGLYLWHGLPLAVLRPMLGAPVGTAVALVASGILTIASWRYVEQPFLAIKARGRTQQAVPGGLSSSAVASPASA